MTTRRPILIVIEEHGIPKRHALQLIKNLSEKLDADLHLYMSVYQRGYEKPLDPDSRHTRVEARHVVDARHRLNELKNKLSIDCLVTGETLNWKHPSSEMLPSLISSLTPQHIVVVRPMRNSFKRLTPSNKHWRALNTNGIPVIFTDPDFKVSLSKDVWAAVEIFNESVIDNELNDQIIRQAQRLADMHGGNVHLVHCHHTGYQLTEYVLSLSQTGFIGGDPAELRGSRDKHQAALEALADNYNIPARRIHNLPGVAKVMLPILASRRRPLFVVAGAAHKSLLRKWFVGSTTKTLMKRLTVPLCLVYQSTALADVEENMECDALGS